jgi:uncharacterized protein (DUF1810 family)
MWRQIAYLVTVSRHHRQGWFDSRERSSRLSDSFDLHRFADAQEAVYRQVVEELSRGRKRTHWMWFVFPQIAGLGFSVMAQRFAIGSRAEAAAYLAHDVLVSRLIDCKRLVMAASEKPITDILGSPDDMKFRSCMTLFDAICEQEIFAEANGTFYPDGKDPATLAILDSARRGAAECTGTRPKPVRSLGGVTGSFEIVVTGNCRNHARKSGGSSNRRKGTRAS